MVGRSGAGKSSIFTALMRLAEPQGRITIDGVNIKRLNLTDLRKNLCVIPQVWCPTHLVVIGLQGRSQAEAEEAAASSNSGTGKQKF